MNKNRIRILVLKKESTKKLTKDSATKDSAMGKETNLFEPRQKRSQKSLERLLAASQNLIASGNFGDASVQDITRQAEYSVGGFYSRFRNKEALFEVVQDRVFEESREWVKKEIGAFVAKTGKKPNGPALKDCVNFCVNLLFRLYSRNPGVYRAIYLHTRIKRDPILFSKVKTFNTKGVKDSVQILKMANDATVDEKMVERWITGLGIVAAFLRESVLFGDPIPSIDNLPPKNIVRAASDMFLHYLSN